MRGGGFGGAGIERVHHIRLAVNGSRGFVGSMRASEQMRLRVDIATYCTSASSDFSTCHEGPAELHKRHAKFCPND